MHTIEVNDICNIGLNGLTELRPCLYGINEQGTIVKTLYCTRDGRFYVHYADGWHKQKPSFNPGKQNHQGGSAYPEMRNFGNKLCHHLMTHAWLGPLPEGKERDHLNGNKLDWNILNLRYLTHPENIDWGKRLKQLRRLGINPTWLNYSILRALASLPTEQAERVINRFRFEAGTSDDAISTERINMTFAFLLDELKSEQS